MPDATDEAVFTFNWLALKLLGKGLYSNPWSALSELVANGLDAQAHDVYVYVDARDKSNAIVEVIDNGTGMSRADIDTYVKVGHNKRETAGSGPTLRAPMGRKGIGKLAALFLSRQFYVATKQTSSAASSWILDARQVEDDDVPRLIATTDLPSTANDQLWAEQTSGTRLILMEVDLSGYGPQSISGLGSRLANQFLLPENDDPKILMSVVTQEGDASAEYEVVRKSIAFRNFAFVAENFAATEREPTELQGNPPVVRIPAKGLPGDEYEHERKSIGFASNEPEDEAWSEVQEQVDWEAQTYQGVKFELTGWIGAHATIEPKAARKNDERFVKNKYYNPAQLRVYVRDKLANDQLLTQLGLTSLNVNYVEGEITFDILDDDSLADIATSNRQDFDETDGRVVLLRALVRPVVRKLISERTELAAKITELTRKEKQRRESISKSQFSAQVAADLAQHSELNEEARDDLQAVITNKIKGDVSPKTRFRVFISHARDDQIFASFIDEVLQSRGAKRDEIFYTSRSGSVDAALDMRSLSAVIKESITDANTLIFYMTSHNFLKSQYCLFEGGAGWATRAVSEYLKLNMDYTSIPTFLTNGKAEVTLLDAAGSGIKLTPELYSYLVLGVFNPMIEHLNLGRRVEGADLIRPFEPPKTPSAIEMKRSGADAEDYFDESLKEYWDLLVSSGLDDYISSYVTPTA